MKHAPLYPVFLNLSGRVCVVVGGGAVAGRKIARLLSCGAEIRIVARELSPVLSAEAAAGRVRHAATEYDPAALSGAWLVFAATSDGAANRRVAEDARRLGLFCDMATDPELGSLQVPAVVERGPVVVAVSTGGGSPALAGRIRDEIAASIGPEWGGAAALLSLARGAVQAHGLGTERNQEIFRSFAALPLPDLIRGGCRAEAARALCAASGGVLSETAAQTLWDEAWTASFSS